MCNIKESGKAAMLQKSSIIIWDQCTMAHKLSLESFHGTMQDVKGNNKRFGGTVLLMSGGCWQTLPVILRSTFTDEINALLKQSFLSVEKFRLTMNMRVQLQSHP